MSLSNTHKLPEIQKLLKELEKEATRFHLHELSFSQGWGEGIEYCIRKIREIIDSA